MSTAQEKAAQFASQVQSGKGFTPQPKADRQSSAQSQPSAAITVVDTKDAARDRVIQTASAGGELVQGLMNAAQTQARQQAEAIAAYPQLVDALTVGYLQDLGVTDAGKSTEPSYSFSGAIDGIESFRQLMDGSQARAKQIAAARNAQPAAQLPSSSAS